MSLQYINGKDLVRSVKAGCIKLEHNREKVNLLNVFPVPDGDTGTNMYLTLLAAVKEGEKNMDQPLGKVAKAMSSGSLMGARGNSGVILSQIFRGIAKVLEGKEESDALLFAQALKSGSDTAYKAVMKPVEGTILTVIREISRACEMEAKKNNDLTASLLAGINAGYITLEKTPSMLPVLKEAGVVDSGGQGLLYFLEGMMEIIAGEYEIKLQEYRDKAASAEIPREKEEVSLDFQYCTEMLVKGTNIDVDRLREQLSTLGDSMLVVGEEEIVKVHIHSNHPGKILETCLQWGNLSDIKINNMLEEVHEQMLNWEEAEPRNAKAVKKIGLVAVGGGKGIIEILKSLGVDIVVEGGQTMNPSTEELLNASQEIDAEAVIILPNNSNVIMAAEQAAQLSERRIEVVKTKSVMQAVTALIAFDPEGELNEIAEAMREEIQNVNYGEITYAVRDSSVNGFKIQNGDVLGIVAGEITVVCQNNGEAVIQLLERMVKDDTELITLFYGGDVTEEEAIIITAKVQETYEDVEVELHYGGQPHYSFLLSAE
ncbi:MAG TPA: DAK2 domain-containing protein [Syntrophomonadaceae bacterium]|nr:DAK2 domain-containing protein [Syntrophomonadaceae bacterium]HRX20448.1 DAK2 domain-containing protein [Syntrophomonadaceae bacterium]